jgi:5,5'-dehydrodivanillate O-demethylase oxygenase subunit
LFAGRVEGDCLRCFYHGWKYDAGGQCVEQPAEDESFARKVRMNAYPTRLYHGLVFAYLGEGEPPAFPELERFSRPGLVSSRSYVRNTNYFNSLENSVDYTHPFFVHMRSEFTGIGVNREIPRVDAEESAYGLIGKKVYSDGRVSINHILMPVAAFITVVEGTTTLDHLAYRVPIDDHSHRAFILNYADLHGDDAQRFLALRAERAELMRRLPPGQEIMELQPPIDDREPDRLGRGDFAIVLLRKIFERELAALEAGDRPTDWQWPYDLRVQLDVVEIAGKR